MSWISKILGRPEDPTPVSFPSLPIMGAVEPTEANTDHLGDAEVADEGDVDRPVVLGRLYNGKDADASSVGGNQTESVGAAHSETAGVPGLNAGDVTLKRGTFGPDGDGPGLAGDSAGAEAEGTTEHFFHVDLKEGRAPDGEVDGLAAAADAPEKGGNVEFEWKVEEGESAPPAGLDALASPVDAAGSKDGGNVDYGWKIEEGESAPRPEIDDLAPAADSEGRGVFVKSWSTSGDADDRPTEGESGEKGGTEDINIGVGELQEIELEPVKVTSYSISGQGADAPPSGADGFAAGDDSAEGRVKLNEITITKKTDVSGAEGDEPPGPGDFASGDDGTEEARRTYEPIVFTKRVDRSSPSEEEDEPSTLADLEAEDSSEIAGKFSALQDTDDLPDLDDIDLDDDEVDV